MAKILVTGASGFLGSALTKHLVSCGYKVNTLTRKKLSATDVQSFVWNPDKEEIDVNAFEDVSAVINLAGENVGSERWTDARKEKILESRLKSTNLLFNTLKDFNQKPLCFINASAIGIYGTNSGDELQIENSSPGPGFLAKITHLWELEANKLETLGIRLIKLRIGVVLSLEGGALPKIYGPIKFGIGSALGNGRQGMSWIHLQDLCKMISFCIENQAIAGPINAVSPNPSSNKSFMEQIAITARKPFFFPPVPSFVLYTILGEMADIVVGGNYVSSKKIESFGFKYQFPNLKDALIDIFQQNR